VAGDDFWSYVVLDGTVAFIGVAAHLADGPRFCGGLSLSE
jgi:hypothetical protein